MNKNSILKKAFEEAAEREINSLPREEQIVRPYSEEFETKMQTLFDSFGEETEKTAPVKKRKVKWAALIAAVLMTVVFSVTASAIIKGDSMWKLFDFTADPENYETIDIEAEGAVVNGEDYDTLIYSGEPITLKYTIDTGESWDWPDRGVMVYLDGVRQTFDAKVGEKEYRDTEMLHIQNEPGIVKEFEITFEPNIGKKGNEMFLSVVAIFDPYVTYYPQCKTEHKDLFASHWDNDNDRICDKCLINIDEVPSGPSSYTMHAAMIKVVMEKDAPVQTVTVNNFSGMKVDELHKRIYKSYEYEDSYENKLNDYDTMKSLAAVLYKSVRSSYISEWGVYGHVTRIETKAKENDEFTVNLHGGAGKYRVSVCINNEIQTVFDGSAYADVEVTSGNQTELTFNLDTTKLPKGDNYLYVMYQKLDGEEDIYRWIDHSQIVYTIEVK